MRGDITQRREATHFLREINDFPEVTALTCIYLKSHRRTHDSENLELCIKTNHDLPTHRIIKRLARKHSFRTKNEPGGFLVIYTPERTPLEIIA